MNPMIRKELRMHMRNNRGWWILSAYQLILIAITAIIYWNLANRNSQAGAVIGENIFIGLTFTQLAVLLLLTPVFSAGSITIEYEQKTMPGLLSSLLTPFAIWRGKLIASLLYLGLLWISSLPIMGIALVLGGVGEKEILKGFFGTGILIGCFCSVGILCSSWFRRSVHSTALTYAIIISLNVLTAVLYFMTYEGHRFKNIWRRSPILFNPFFGMISLLMPENSDMGKYDWCISLGFFLLLGVVSALLAIRNLRCATP